MTCVQKIQAKPKVWKDKLKSHKDALVFTQFLEDKILLSVSADGGLRIWDLKRRKISKKVELFESSMRVAEDGVFSNNYCDCISSSLLKLCNFVLKLIPMGLTERTDIGQFNFLSSLR